MGSTHGCNGEKLSPLSFFLKRQSFQNRDGGLDDGFGGKDRRQKEDLRRKMTKRCRTQGDLRNLGFVKRLPLLPLFESCADIIAMMTLKKVVAFSPLTNNPDRCVNPKDLNRQQPARRTC